MTEIKNLSVIVVKKRFVHRVADQLVTTGQNVDYLKKEPIGLIAYYLLVQCIERNLPNVNLLTNREEKWQCVYGYAIKYCPNIFRVFSSDMCMKLFNRLSRFYVDTFYELNSKMEPRLQKR